MRPYTTILLAALTLTTALAGCLTPNEPPPATGDGEPDDGADDATLSPYRDQLASEIRGMTPAEIRALRNGEGAGFARAAELNAYPGPRHVLDLADELNLTDVQRREMQRLFDAMQADAKRVGAAILDEEAALEAAFRDRTIDAEALEARVQGIAELQGELRTIHLATHLKTVPVLTHDQVMRYNELRGYGSVADHDPSRHGGH